MIPSLLLAYEAPHVETLTSFALVRIVKPYSLKRSPGRCFSAWPAHTQPESDPWQANWSGIVSVAQEPVMADLRMLRRNLHLNLAKYWA